MKEQNRVAFAIDRLMNAKSFPHEVNKLELLETHISWVILTGPFAYKIKKPVKFDFVDYSTLDRRKQFCEIEVELNRRFAPELYLGVVPIFGGGGELTVGDEKWLGHPAAVNVKESGKLRQNASATEPPIEFAVKMRQFSQDAIVAARLQSPELSSQAVEQLGRDIARFHDSIECAPPTLINDEHVLKDAIDNFEMLRPAFKNDPRLQLLQKLECWTTEQYNKLAFEFTDRTKLGNVRRCHGDMHLKNVIQVDEKLTPFDGIEFNENFQWIDVISEIAFPVMDFVARGRADLGWRLLNAYFEATGDYNGLAVLKFYLVYRAMVRAKVTWLNPNNQTDEVHAKYSSGNRGIDSLAGPWDKYLRAAKHFAFELKPSLSITHGFSGSGKSTIAMKKIVQTGGVRIRSDSERHRLAAKFKVRDKYSQKMTSWVYAFLVDQARTAIEAGLPVIIDATFLKRDQRKLFEELATELEVEYQINDCKAPFEELSQRIKTRGSDPSEATIEVLKNQIVSLDPLTKSELEFCFIKSVDAPKETERQLN